MMALLVFGGASFSVFHGALYNPYDSPLSMSFLILLTAFVFTQSWTYYVYVLGSLSALLIARTWGRFGIDQHFITLAILGPLYDVIARSCVIYLQRRITRARLELQSKIQQLEAEKTKRKESEKQLIHAQKMEGLGLLAAGVAHDFNNHLQSIQSFAELIEKDIQPDENAKYIQSATLNASEICRRMLAYAGKTHEQQKVFDLIELLEKAKPVLHAGLPKTIQLNYRLDQGPAWIRANENAVLQCLTNLVQNAVDAMTDQKGTLEIVISSAESPLHQDEEWRTFGSDSPAGPAVLLEVIDNGDGMDDSTLECCFDPYFTTKDTGNGFGLSTTIGIIGSFGGIMRCQTRSGYGTRMQIILPRSDEPDLDSDVLATQSISVPVHKVLLVDDEFTVLDAISRLLESEGLHVTCADSGTSALENLGAPENRFDLLLVDYSMPDMNGMDLLEIVREKEIQTQAILMSGFVEEVVDPREGDLFDAFLAKPFDMSDLAEAIQTSKDPASTWPRRNSG